MLRKKTCIAMLLAGGQGSRLGILTKNVAKPAVPYGGKYRKDYAGGCSAEHRQDRKASPAAGGYGDEP